MWANWRASSSGQSLAEFLQKVVSVIAYHMKAAVCSVYLFDDNRQELVLSASQGLNPSRQTRLKLGEGIVGEAGATPTDPRGTAAQSAFKLIPGLQEEPTRPSWRCPSCAV